MPKFKCTKCIYTTFYTHVKYKVVEGNFVPDVELICPDCGSEVIADITEVPNFTEATVSVGRFDSMSKGEQKEVLKKRARANYNKYHKAGAQQKQHETIEAIKEQFKIPKK